MQLYCKQLGIYADLSDGSNFTFSLQNQWQHFFEEPEDFSFSTQVPITENNLKIFGSDYEIDVVVDNYVVVNRFLSKVISKNLATMEVSLYRTRISKHLNVYEEYGVNWVEFTKAGYITNNVKLYASKESADKNNNKPNCTIWTHNKVKDKNVYFWKYDTSGEYLVGQGQLQAYIPQPYEVAVLRVTLPTLLECLLGYVPKEYAEDKTWVDFPFRWNAFKMEGTITIDSIYKNKNNKLIYYPKYGEKGKGTQFKTNWYNASSPWGEQPWNALYYVYYPFATERDNIRYDYQNTESLITVDEKIPVFTHTDILPAQRFHGLYGANENNKFYLSYDVSQAVDLTDKSTYMTDITPSMIISQYYEELAKCLPLLCDYQKGIDTLFKHTYQTLEGQIIDWKENLKINKEDQEIQHFKIDFGSFTPYWFGSVDKGGTMHNLICNDMYLNFGNFVNMNMLCTFINGKYVFNVNRVQKDYKGNIVAVGTNTRAYLKEYKQNIITEVEFTCIDYNFSNTIIVGSRYFVVDKVETSDFKIFKITMIEYPAEE